MSGTAAVVVALILAALLVAAFSKPGKMLVGGFIQRDSKGRLVLVLTPTKRPKRKKRRKR